MQRSTLTIFLLFWLEHKTFTQIAALPYLQNFVFSDVVDPERIFEYIPVQAAFICIKV